MYRSSTTTEQPLSPSKQQQLSSRLPSSPGALLWTHPEGRVRRRRHRRRRRRRRLPVAAATLIVGVESRNVQTV